MNFVNIAGEDMSSSNSVPGVTALVGGGLGVALGMARGGLLGRSRETDFMLSTLC